ncbi:hypothetical protein [Chondromyces crocatus]|uniref:Peptidase C51 domain-containing protein n=1 Tax=Chondromyces crocatus TaxID=52 RepID=A0A0K1ECC0_CHOCO|nr:hypothetical protein [Chondromyces crocatus]AKT38499.1 uncharacterized protein CMC5_026450 [Chondromyces crocatus]
MTNHARCFAKVCFSLALVCALSLSTTRASAQPVFMDWALELVDNVAPPNNAYGSAPFFIKWPGINGSAQYENRTLCSNFLTALLQQAYGISAAQIWYWTGSTSPNALKYHDTIVDENGFNRIQYLDELEQGDIIAIYYPGVGGVSGHVSIVEHEPIELTTPIAPIIPGTRQFAVGIIDSTEKGHGDGDSRLKSNGSWVPGAGRGVMRFYADDSGEFAGHTWSLSPHSVYYDMSARPIAVGRLP